MVPEIADYEARREFLRQGAPADDLLANLDALSSAALLPLSRAAILKAAEFWALLRNEGRQTADDKALDCDTILAAQAVTATLPEDRVIIATTNVDHLCRFPGVEAQPWDYVS
ncbi:type II toxin-antitoxin system VapC family toxin [Tautonia plasticadhaerens]|nr:hypothetical protein [Tautonia plasticadhaerens]